MRERDKGERKRAGKTEGRSIDRSIHVCEKKTATWRERDVEIHIMMHRVRSPLLYIRGHNASFPITFALCGRGHKLVQTTRSRMP